MKGMNPKESPRKEGETEANVRRIAEYGHIEELHLRGTPLTDRYRK